MEVDLLDGPGVLDRVAVALVEGRVAHRAQGQAHAGVEAAVTGLTGGSQDLGVLQGAGDGLWSEAPVEGPARSPAGCGSRGASAGSTWSSGPTSRRGGTSSDSLPMVGLAMNRLSDWLWSMYGLAGGGHVDQGALRELPGGAEQGAHIAGRSGQTLDRAVRLADGGADRLRPQAAGLEFGDEGVVDLEELAAQRLALEEIGHLRLDALVAARDRGDGRRGGDGDQQRVPQAVFGDASRGARSIPG